MSTADNNKGDTIKNKIGGAGGGQAKKKLVIKKQEVTKSKTIADHINRETKPGPAQSPRAGQNAGTAPAARSPQPGGPAAKKARTDAAVPSRKPPEKSPRETQGSDRRPQRHDSGPNRSGNQNQSGGGSGQGTGKERPAARVETTMKFAAAGTPFDAAFEASRRPGGGQGRRSPAQGGSPGAGAAAGTGTGSVPAGGGGYRGGPPRGPFQGARGRKPEENERFYHQAPRRKPATVSGTTVPDRIEIMESIQVGELAKKLNLKPSDVISRLMKMGEMVTINKVIDAAVAVMVAAEYNCEVKVVSLYDETVIEEQEDLDDVRVSRPPIVTIMGHVDHGKTKLLDAIRKSNVVATEAGAITQHIGAYQVEIPRGKITFLDTPGHEAFTAMRARGAGITDIVVLVVAADDGVMQQTEEAIAHAKEAKVPIIVAVNKIDLPSANPDKVRQQLATHGLNPEEWGGTTIYCPVSALKGEGIDHLLEMILLQAEVMELKSNPSVRAQGCVVEAKVDPGKGPVATILVQKGVLREGDPYVVGIYSGRVRAMFNDLGLRIKEAGLSCPVEITGIDGVPEAGDPFTVVENEKFGREIAYKRQHYRQITEAAERAQPSLTDINTWMQDQEFKELKVIIKADVKGSVEAIREGLLKLSSDDVKIKVVHGATGAITESDVSLAAASAAIIISFNTRPSARAQELAAQQRIEIKYYNIIYDVIEDVKSAMEGLLEPDKVEEITGTAEIREVFKISRMGNIAGCMITRGKIRKSGGIRLIRDSVVVYTGTIKSLRRVKDDVSEVAEGFECGIAVDGYNDLRIGDVLEGFEIKTVARKLTLK